MTTDTQKIRVLLAEDHTLMREMTRQLFDRSGLQVVAEASDGAEAVRLALQHRPDVAVMDIAMPHVNGVEATRQIKERLPATAILVLTSYDDDQYIDALLEAGAAGYLLKTVSAADLVEAVHRVHVGEAVLHPRIAKKVLERLARKGPVGVVASQDTSITDREWEVLRLAAIGKSNKEIATKLGVSDRTVQAHLSHIFSGLQVASRTEAVIRALRRGWLRLEDLGEE